MRRREEEEGEDREEDNVAGQCASAIRVLDARRVNTEHQRRNLNMWGFCTATCACMGRTGWSKLIVERLFSSSRLKYAVLYRGRTRANKCSTSFQTYHIKLNLLIKQANIFQGQTPQQRRISTRNSVPHL
jgi:hypothetical protein